MLSYIMLSLTKNNCRSTTAVKPQYKEVELQLKEVQLFEI